MGQVCILSFGPATQHLVQMRRAFLRRFGQMATEVEINTLNDAFGRHASRPQYDVLMLCQPCGIDARRHPVQRDSRHPASSRASAKQPGRLSGAK